MAKIDTLEGQYIKINGLETFYQQIGEGDALILLHGGGLTSSIWPPHQPILAEQFHVFTPDLWGHGRMNNPSGVFSYQMIADDLLAFIKALKLEKPFVCGWSMGEGVMLEFAMKFPDEVQALVCCGGGPPLSEAEIEELI
jgi:pimeloyl-ACP methyl ester carboxylesterase